MHDSSFVIARSVSDVAIFLSENHYDAASPNISPNDFAHKKIPTSGFALLGMTQGAVHNSSFVIARSVSDVAIFLSENHCDAASPNISPIKRSPRRASPSSG